MFAVLSFWFFADAILFVAFHFAFFSLTGKDLGRPPRVGMFL
jgi:hypothetical protein